MAQPCSINLGADRTICQGQSTTITAPAGFPNYLWSTGSTASSITVGTAGTYWGEASYPSGELVTNGNFSAGNTGFTSQFNYNSTLVTDGNYWIGTNAATFHPQFIGTGNGQFLMVNGGPAQPGMRPWCQTVPVCPGQTYTLSYRGVSLANQNPPLLTLFVNNDWTFQERQFGPLQNQWQTFTHTWTAPAGVTSAEFCIQLTSGWGVGNDFGIDDISISATVTLRDWVDVSVTPAPIVDLGPDVSLCVGQNLTLDAGVAGGTYLWQNGATGSTYQVSNPGNYIVMVTANGCSATDAIAVTYNAVPAVDLGADLTLCSGQSTTLNAAVPGGTYGWQDGSTNATFNVTGPGTYSVNVNANGCSASDQIDIYYNPTPVVDLGADQTLCEGDQMVLDVTTPGATYLWQDGSTGPTFTATTNGAYDATVTVNGCPANDLVNLAFTPLPIVDLGPDQTTCPGDAVLLDATVIGGTYLWQDGSSGATFNATAAGNYTVDVTANGCTASDLFTLSQFSLQTVDLGPDVTFCQGASASIGTIVPGATYAWNSGETSSSITVASAGIRWLDVTLNGCTVRDSIAVFVTPLPVVDLGLDRTICPGDLALLDATTPGATYLWNTGAVTPTINASNGNYDVTVTVNGCDASDAVVVDNHPTPLVDLGADVSLCPGTQLVLDATQPGASYVWQDGSIASTFTVVTDGTYDVDLTDANGCAATDAITVVYAVPAPIDLGPDVTICEGSTITLDATVPGATYLWTNGSVTPTITVGTAGNFGVTVAQGSCTVSDAIVVAVAALPTVALGNDATLCPGEQIVLNATGPGLTYAWSTGAITPTITVSSGGTYDVLVTNAANCTATDAIDIAYASPSAIDLGADVVLCQGENVVFDATLPGSSYGWSTGASTPTVTISTAGEVWVEVTQGNCSVSDTVQVQVQPMPQAALGNDATLCAGENIVLDATWPGATYLWNTGAVTPTLTAATTGTYSVDVDLNGCISSDAIDINVLSATSLNLGPDITLCAGEQIVLDATTPGSSYDWNTGSSSATITVTTSGTYWAEVSTGQCSVSDTVIVTVNPMPQVALGNDATLCSGDDILLDATWPGATYLWNTGAATPTLTAATTGTYSVDVVLNGCVASDAIDVNVLSATSLNLGPDITLCAGEQIVLDATTPGSSYDWSTGATSATITVTTSGTYWAEVSTGQCGVSDTVLVTVNPMPQVALGNDATLCAGDDILLDATWPGATYLWNTGAVTPTLTAATTGTYSVDVDLNGCTASDAISITVLTPDAIELGNDIVACEGDAIILDATIAGASYLWNTGEQTAALDVNISGTYWVDVSQSGCVVSDTIIVQVNPTPQIDLGADQTFCEGETSATLDATWAGASHLWSTGDVSPTLAVSTSGTYSVAVDLNGCVATDIVQVTFGSLSIDLGPDTTLCTGQTLELEVAIPNGSTTWNDVTNSPIFTITDPGTYWVVFTGVSGCAATDTITVQYDNPGTVDLGPDLSLCEGQTHELNASLPGAVIQWEDGSSDAVRNVSTSGMYSVEAIVGQCVVADAIAIDFNPLPSVDLGADVQICPGAQALFDATTADASYFWQDGSSDATLSIGTAGEVTVTVNVNGCSSSDEVLVSLLDGPTPDLGADATICQGASLVLTATENGSTYQWDDGSILDTRTVSSAGPYWVDVSRNGCTARDSIRITVFDPNVLELGADRTICAGSTTQLDAFVPGAQYAWSTGAITPAIMVGAAGEFAVTITVSGCTAQDAILVSVLDLDTPELGPDVTICEGATVDLGVEDNGGSTSWSTGETGTTISVSAPGSYTVTIDSLGCTVSDMVVVNTQGVITELDLGEARSICPGAFDVLEPSFIAGATYVWSTGATGPLLSINAPGTYSVTATGTCINAMASIVISAGDCDTYVFVPDGFTPNSDGINDVFLPSLAGPVDRYELDIFDRWGERIATITDRAEGWDGSYNNVASQDGVYVWTLYYRVLTPTGVKAERITGHVTLLR